MYSGKGNLGRGNIAFLFVFLAAALILVVYVMTGCGQDSPGGAETGEQSASTIQIRGSDSEVNLVQRLAELFMDENTGVQIAVTGGGSGTGIAALIDNTIDIANSSRPMKQEEFDQAKANGVDAVPVRFAVDGVAVIVNENNPLDTLSVKEIGAIFRGDITNWKEVGGEDSPIGIYGRQSNSGTYVFFMEQVLQGDYTPQMRNMGGNADIVEAITSDKTGIGYVAIGYVTDGGSVRAGIKPMNVSRKPGETGFTPIKLENITSGKYPITRPLYQFINGQPAGALKDFIMFELSDRGQEIVLEQGFYPITDEDREFNKNSLQ